MTPRYGTADGYAVLGLAHEADLFSIYGAFLRRAGCAPTPDRLRALVDALADCFRLRAAPDAFLSTLRAEAAEGWWLPNEVPPGLPYQASFRANWRSGELCVRIAGLIPAPGTELTVLALSRPFSRVVAATVRELIWTHPEARLATARIHPLPRHPTGLPAPGAEAIAPDFALAARAGLPPSRRPRTPWPAHLRTDDPRAAR